ncbi:NepR family anti-sigma factor [Methylobacterium sp. J-070]|uniref:NepR family anti-sigma factor n=1 Tax=Methylobacterium sp. J-070 TaxID=2836650 RepID=UPI001FBAA23C|nr:NepR family anti-sigma factor [Methylobacterium sp. J-070]MCJ2048701.1 hypothetical protein [Methylobacterium sp. J-070]
MTGTKAERATEIPTGAADVTGPAAGRPPRPAGPPDGTIGEAARARIGRGLRLHYAEVLALPIPDRLRTLLDDLAACSDTEA